MVAKLCLLALMLTCCQAANILYVIPFTSYSHYIMLRPIGLELARRGHNVTVVTAFRETEHPPTYHQVMAEDKKIWETGSQGVRPNVFTMVDMSEERFHDEILWTGGSGSTEVALSSPEIQDFLKKDSQFDVVISEQFYQEAFFMLAHKYKAPLVLVTTYGNCMRHNIIIRNPLQLSTVISEFIEIREPLSFFGRLKNLYFTVYEIIMWRYYYLEKQYKLVEKYILNIPEPVPSLIDLERNSVLTLVNSHFSFDGPVAYLPNIVEIGGIHLFAKDLKNNSVPQDLQNILDNAKHGIVYVNFGTNVKSSELPLEKKNAFLNVFRKLKQTVLWKWENNTFVNKPDNLVVRKWMPQKEILSHPNIKVFISHGGLIGTQEAIVHGVPIIGIPIYADQYNNLLQAQDIGFGKILNFHDITEKTLETMLNDVLKDDTFTNNAKLISQRFKDRPMNPVDTAMFWIEYVIRNKGADYMKNPAIKLNWFAYQMFDVYLFVLALFLVPVVVVFKFIKFLIGFTVAKESKDVKKKLQ